MNDLEKAMAFWRANPVAAVKDWFKVVPTDYQGDILTDLLAPVHNASTNRVAVKSGHGVGKTTTEAWCIWVYLMTRAHSRVACTAPTASQLNDILWPELAKWHANMPEELRDMWALSATHIRHKANEKTWFAVGRTSNKPENMQGFHNDNILVVCEEASGIPQNIYEVIEGILSNADEHGQEAKLLMVGNPTQTAGEFYNAFHRNKDIYARYTISGDIYLPEDPNGGKLFVSPRVSQKYRDTMAKKYGRDSAVYDVRVRGLFPKTADDVVIPLQWAEAGQLVPLPAMDPVVDEVTLVMDVARYGGDETVLGEFRKGHCLSVKAWPKTSTNECLDILWERVKHRGDKLNVCNIIVDEPGIGGGVIDVGIRMGLPITSYNGGVSMIKDQDDPEDCRMFLNRRARDWWHVRRLLEKGLLHLPADETLINQLASVKYEYADGTDKIKVESKKKMRERLGDDASPDRADVIVMGCAPPQSFGEGLDLSGLDGLDSDDHVGQDRPTMLGEEELF